MPNKLNQVVGFVLMTLFLFGVLLVADLTIGIWPVIVIFLLGSKPVENFIFNRHLKNTG